MSFIKPLNLNIAAKLEDKKFRKVFFRGQAQEIIAMSIKMLRKKRSILQGELAKKTGTQQSAISRVEQAEYSAWSLKTLFRVADALDARLKITLEPAEDVIKEYKKMEEEEIPATIGKANFRPSGASIKVKK
jgi:transcriptional regulator with XRE-family HTH domain